MERARRVMADAGLDVLVVTNRDNLTYFIGVTRTECLAVLIPVEGEPCAVALWLDADYVCGHSGPKTHACFFPRQILGPAICERIKTFGNKNPKTGLQPAFWSLSGRPPGLSAGE